MKFDVSAPLLGFESIQQVDLERIDDVFVKMQAVGQEHISFTLVDPFILRPYDFEVPQKIQDLLEITDTSNILILNIVLIQTPIEESVVNFIAPLVFNTDNNKTAQVIISDSKEYGVAEKISAFLNK